MTTPASDCAAISSTDAAGRYRFLTIMPASYEGRTRHLHVKVQAPGGRVFTTQLYFPGEAHNRSDRLFRLSC
jgi:protocatechuate 3,4-dioxygenase beta subunit